MPYDPSTNRWVNPRAADVSVDHADLSKDVLVAEDVDRVVVIDCLCTETIGGSTPATFLLGISADTDLFAAAAVFAAAGTAGNRFTVSGTLPANQKLVATTTAGTGGTPAGKFSVRVIASPVAN